MSVPSPQDALWEIEGNFLIWEPDLKSPGAHRLIDSNRPQTTYFKYGNLTIDKGSLFLVKNRHFLKFLVFICLTPIWGGLTIGLLAWIGSFLKQDFNYAGIVILTVTAIVIWLFVFLLGKIIKPLWRRLELSQVANVRVKHVQITRNNVVESSGMLGVDFTIMPDVDSNHGSISSPGPVDAQKCSFVTFIALTKSDASDLSQLLPKTQVPLTDKFNPDIPPQQSARWVAAEPNANSPEMMLQQSYRHSANKWLFTFYCVICGIGAFMEGHFAATNHQGIRINGLPLGPVGATILLYFFMVMLGGLFLVLAAYTLQCFINPHSLLMRADGIIFFEGWLRPKQTFIPFGKIDTISQQQDAKGGARILILVVGKKQFCIREAYLGNRQAYENIQAAIAVGRMMARRGEPALKPVIRRTQEPPADDSRYMPKE